jgi:hypothetical protein
MIDDTHDTFKGGIATIPLLRSQADGSDEPGEASTNPEDLWPRSVNTRGTRVPVSNGSTPTTAIASVTGAHVHDRSVDTWTDQTLNDSGRLRQANTNQKAISVGDTTYFQDGNNCVYRRHYADISTWSLMQVCRVGNARHICTDGYTVYASTNSAIYKTTREQRHRLRTTRTSVHPQVLGFHKGRLMAAKNNVVYNVTGTGAPTWSFTHPNTDFRWTCFGAGTGCIYMGGYSGDKSVIYFVTVKDDGTGLNVPQVAGELPDGEIVRALTGYLGFLCIGTDNGRRLAEMASNNFLTIGALNPKTTLCCASSHKTDSFGTDGRTSMTSTPALVAWICHNSTRQTFRRTHPTSWLARWFGRLAYRARCRVLSHRTTDACYTVQGYGLVRELLNLQRQFSPYFETSEITYGIPDDKVALKLASSTKRSTLGGGIRSVRTSALMAATTNSSTLRQSSRLAIRQKSSALTK